MSADESLEIPIGTAGLTLRFADGDQTLIFSEGQRRIGDQEITTTPTPLMSSSSVATTGLPSIATYAGGMQPDSMYTGPVAPFEMASSNFIA